MLELYEQNRLLPSNDVEGSSVSGAIHQASAKPTTSNDEQATGNSHLQAGVTRPGTSKLASRQGSEQSYAENGGPARTTQSQNNDNRNAELKSAAEQSMDAELQPREAPLHQEKVGEAHVSRFVSEGHSEDGQERESNIGKGETREGREPKDKHFGRNLDNRQSAHGRSPQEAIKKIDKDKVRAALEKRRKAVADVTRKTDFLDEDDLIEKELEDGIELASGSEKNKRDRRQSWPKPSNRPEHGDGPHFNNIEEGEVSALDSGQVFHSPKSSSRKRKAGSPPDDHRNHRSHSDYTDDRNRVGRVGHTERDNKRHSQENQV